jgi:GH18 family chitinase
MKHSTSFAILLAAVAGSVEASHIKGKLSAGSYYAGWLAKDNEYPPSAVSWNKYTDVIYAFAYAIRRMPITRARMLTSR